MRYPDKLTPASSPRPAIVPLAAMAVAIVAIGLYLPSLQNGFVYDDRAQVLVDTYIHDWRHIGDVLTLRVMPMDVLDNNRPMHLLSMLIDAAIWGKNPLGYHLTNVLLHGTCAVLLLLFLRHALEICLARRHCPSPTRATVGAVVGAMLFAVHPANTEAVCPVTFRKDLLVAFFALTALNLMAAFRPRFDRRNIVLGALCAMCCFCASAAKESGVAAAPLVGMYWLLLRREPKSSSKSAAPWAAVILAAVALSAAFITARFLLEPKESVIFPTRPHYPFGTLWSTIQNEPRIWAFQFRQIGWPFTIPLGGGQVAYPFCADQNAYSIRWMSAGWATTILGAGLAAMLALCCSSRLAMLGMAAYWLAIIPVSSFVPIYHPIADRYLYFPMAGIATLVAAGAAILPAKRRTVKLAMGGVAVLVLVVLAVKTWQRQDVWRDSIALWEDTAMVNPMSGLAANNLGFAYYDVGRYEKALESWGRGTMLNVNHPDNLAGMAIGFEAIGNSAQADAAFRAAVSHDARYQEPKKLIEALSWETAQAAALERIASRNPPSVAKSNEAK